MQNAVRIFRIKQELSDDDVATLTSMSSEDLCFFRFIGGNSSETEKLADQLYRLKATGVFLIGVFRFPFRFEGKKRLQTAVSQYYWMRDLCDAVTYLMSDGMLEMISPDVPLHKANRVFDSLDEAPGRAIEEMIEMHGDMNIDVHDIQTFLRGAKGPVYIRTFEGETFDEPLKYVLSTPYLPMDYADGEHMIVNMGYTKHVDMLSFQQMNLRLNDLFDKADLFKLGTYYIDEPGYRFRITLLVSGVHDPFPRPQKPHRFQLQRLWLKKRWASLSRDNLIPRLSLASVQHQGQPGSVEKTVPMGLDRSSAGTQASR